MIERTERDDIFLDTLERDEDLAWRLAEAAARPAPAGLRERIVERHRRRRGWLRLPSPLPAAIAFAVLALIVLPLSIALVQTRAELERELAVRDEFERVLFAVAAGGGQILPMRPPAGGGFRGPRGAIVRGLGTDATAYLVLDLPEPPRGRAYEAWVIRDGQPLRAGMAPARTGVVTVRLEHPLRPGDTAAVTLEVASGVDAPTSDPLLVGPA